MRPLALAAVLAALVFTPTAAAWTWPVDGPVLQPFLFDPAHPYAGGQHRGIDIGGDPGAAVRAPVTGVVTFAGTVPASGHSLHDRDRRRPLGHADPPRHDRGREGRRGHRGRRRRRDRRLWRAGTRDAVRAPWSARGSRAAGLPRPALLPAAARHTDAVAAARAARTARRGRPFGSAVAAPARPPQRLRPRCLAPVLRRPSADPSRPGDGSGAAPHPRRSTGGRGEAADSVPPASATGSRAAVQRRGAPPRRPCNRLARTRGGSGSGARSPGDGAAPARDRRRRVATRLAWAPRTFRPAVRAPHLRRLGRLPTRATVRLRRAARRERARAGIRPGSRARSGQAPRAATASSSSPCCWSPCCSRQPAARGPGQA